MSEQLNFLAPVYPPGFRLVQNFISEKEERELIEFAKKLNWENYELMGVVARRKIYSYGEERPFPEEFNYLLPRVANALKVRTKDLVHMLFTYYPIGAPIGWHRDAPQYEKLLGISLENSCEMRLRPYDSNVSPPISVLLPTRSAYVMIGESRWKWEHHIPPAKKERFSLTFRTGMGKKIY